MISCKESWIRIFDIPSTSKHKNGFTIYKVISMLYPESCPDAVTKVTVWKRFNEFKKLHREMKTLHRKLNLKDKYPSLPQSALFKRFEEDTIKQRIGGILNFLEFIGNHSQLFTSNLFVKFFETSLTPVDHLGSNICSIRAELNLPEDPEVSTSLSTHSDDDRLSDTDSFTTIGSLNISVNNPHLFPDSLKSRKSHSNLKKLNSTTSIDSHSSKTSDTVSISTNLDNLTLLDGQIYPTPPQTPGESGDYMQYVVDASVHIDMAVELENDKKYEEAFAAYKTAIDILLKYGKDDNNYERRQLIRYKTEKYLIKAEKIYNMYLAPEIKNLEIMRNDEIKAAVASQKSKLFDLYKYKVLRIVGSGMLVLHSELQCLHYVKVVHKTMEFLNENLVLPENVPYMVKLQNHYNCENALFLVLEYCNGPKFSDFLKSQADSPGSSKKDNDILKQLQDVSDNDSELSFSELINEYKSSRSKAVLQEESDDSFERIDENEFLHSKQVSNRTESGDNSMLCQLQKSGISQSSHSKCKNKNGIDSSNVLKGDVCSSAARKFSEVSNFDEDEFDKSLLVSEERIVRWAAQLLLALDKLHTLGVICRDLQMKNLLLDENEDIVLTYMCNVKDLCDLYSNGVNINLAPEVYSYEKVTQAVDWWSYGAILYELLVGMALSEVHPNGISSYTHLKIPKYVSPEGRSILKQLLSFEPRERLGSGIETLKSHPFFNSVSWNTLLAKYKCC